MKKLFKHQEEAVQFISIKHKVLLADEMGLGKTISSIAAISRNGKFPCIVICPKAVILNWEKEISEFELTSQILTTKTSKLEDVNFYITNYDIVPKILDLLFSINHVAVILDEIHYAKNYKAKRSQAVEKLVQKNYDPIKKENPDWIIGLSGTPIVNHGVEIHQIAKLINPYSLGINFFRFVERYGRPAIWGGYELHPDKYLELNQRLTDTIMLRRKKSDVLDLPEKLRDLIPIEIDEKKYIKSLNEYESKNVLDLMTFERQLVANLKLENGIDFIIEKLESGEKIVVFAHHTDIIKTIQDRLIENNVKTGIYTGDMTQSEREQAIEKFNNEDQCLIVSIKAGGTGVNLQVATHAIFFELDWSPSNLQQAEDRLHRIGQKNVVNIYYLIAKNTIDQYIAENVVKKLNMITAVVEGQAKKEDEEIMQRRKEIYEKLLTSL